MKTKQLGFFVISLLLIISFISFASALPFFDFFSNGGDGSNKIKLKYYVYSMDSESNNFEESLIYQLYTSFTPKYLELEPSFYLTRNVSETLNEDEYCIDSESGKICSKNGIKELEETMRELCILQSSKTRAHNYISQVNQNCTLADIDTCWKTQAELYRIRTDKVEECVELRGLMLLEKEIQDIENFKPKFFKITDPRIPPLIHTVNNVLDIFINKRVYDSRLYPDVPYSVASLTKAICSQAKGINRPPAC